MQLSSYASDLLEDAMNLAQTKAMASFNFRDCINTLTELWGYCYEKIALIDSGFYSKTARINRRLTTLPPHVKNTVRVYRSRDKVGFSRKVYKTAGMNDLNSSGTFHLSGNDLYCWDAEWDWIWVEYVPEPCMVTFTHHNRDYKIVWKEGDTTPRPTPDPFNNKFGMYELVEQPLNNVKYTFKHRGTGEEIDATKEIVRPGWVVTALILDHPWAFVSYRNAVTGEYESFVGQGVLNGCPATKYNPFDYQGRGSNVEYIKARYNDYTGMGVVIRDYADGAYKELGWTPDTLMCYPSRIMYNYMVASMAQRFAAVNGSTIMAVEMALVQAQDEMGNWLKKNKSGWVRADNVTGPMISDFL